MSHRFVLALTALFAGALTLTAQEPLDGTAALEVVMELRADLDPAVAASAMGAQLVQPVGAIPHTWLFRFPSREAYQEYQARPQVKAARQNSQRDVRWAEVQQPRRLKKHVAPQTEPLFPKQWYLQNIGQSSEERIIDVGVTSAWSIGADGAGAVVAVVDDGFDPLHPDLSPNYRSSLSYDFNYRDNNPTYSGSDDGHSVAVGGIIAAAANDLGITGIAPAAELASLRLLSLDATDAQVADTLNHRLNDISIYNNSWGYASNGIVFFEVDNTVRNALAAGVTQGRNGKGNIYVWSAGNDGDAGDRADYDELASARYNITVGAVAANGEPETYSEPCACLLVSAPSGDILTTDIRGTAGSAPGDYTYQFGGTSASAPMVSGVAALILKTNPSLNWRDVMHILAISALPNGQEESLSETQRHYLPVNPHDYRMGFGIVNAGAAVALAGFWQSVDQDALSTTVSDAPNQTIGTSSATRRTLAVTERMIVEHVELTVVSNHPRWGDLKIQLTSPNGQVSQFTETHNSANSPTEFTFTSVRHWGTLSTGDWLFSVQDLTNPSFTGQLQSIQLKIHGRSARSVLNRSPKATPVQSIELAEFPATIDCSPFVTDDDGDPVFLIYAQSDENARITITSANTITYEKPDLFREDNIRLFVTDYQGGFRWVTVRASFQNSHEDIFLATQPGGTVTFRPDSNLSWNSAVINRPPTNGAAVFNTNSASTITYTAPLNFTGYDDFSLTLNSFPESRKNVAVAIVDQPQGAFSFRLPQHRLLYYQGPLQQMPRGPITLEAWIYPTDYGPYVDLGYGRIFDYGFSLFLNGSGDGIYAPNSLVFYCQTTPGNSALNSPSGSIQLNQWQHVAVTYNGSGLVNMYINGKSVAAKVVTANDGTLFAPSGLLQITANSLGIGCSPELARNFSGMIREARIWKSVRTFGQITAGMEVALDAARETDLFAYWPMNEGMAFPLIDRKSGIQLDRGSQYYPEFVLLNPPPRITDFFPGLASQGNGWYEASWLGWVNVGNYPFVWHLQHGWWYLLEPGSGGGGWVYSYSPGEWWYVTQSFYPYIYSADRGGWLFYEKETGAPRQFFDFSSNSSIQFP